MSLLHWKRISESVLIESFLGGNTLLEQKLNQLEIEYENHKENLKQEVVHSFDHFCDKIKQVQLTTGQVPSYLIFHLLRTRIINHQYQYIVQFYEDDWYLREGVTIGDFDVSFAYCHFEDIWKKLLGIYQKYVLEISPVDIQCIMLELCEYFHKYVVKLLRYSIMEVIQSEKYKEFQKGNRFMIETGEYYELCDFIHIECKERDFEKIKAWLNKKESSDTYTFEDFRGIDLRNEVFQGMDFRYVDFRGSNLEGTLFLECNLEGAKFHGSNLTNVKFSECNLDETLFLECNLSRTNLFDIKPDK